MNIGFFDWITKPHLQMTFLDSVFEYITVFIALIVFAFIYILVFGNDQN